MWTGTQSGRAKLDPSQSLPDPQQRAVTRTKILVAWGGIEPQVPQEPQVKSVFEQFIGAVSCRSKDHRRGNCDSQTRDHSTPDNGADGSKARRDPSCTQSGNTERSDSADRPGSTSNSTYCAGYGGLLLVVHGSNLIATL